VCCMSSERDLAFDQSIQSSDLRERDAAGTKSSVASTLHVRFAESDTTCSAPQSAKRLVIANRPPRTWVWLESLFLHIASQNDTLTRKPATTASPRCVLPPRFA